jgi:DNA-directed RNA polymerase specialized sigma24 family protein
MDERARLHAQLPRLLPYIRYLARHYVRGMGHLWEVDDFQQEICWRALSAAPPTWETDLQLRNWLWAVARHTRMSLVQYRSNPKRSASEISLDDDEYGSLQISQAGGQHAAVLLSELKRDGKHRLRTQRLRGDKLNDRWLLLWRSAGGEELGKVPNSASYVMRGRQALREDYSL